MDLEWAKTGLILFVCQRRRWYAWGDARTTKATGTDEEAAMRTVQVFKTAVTHIRQPYILSPAPSPGSQCGKYLCTRPSLVVANCRSTHVHSDANAIRYSSTPSAEKWVEGRLSTINTSETELILSTYMVTPTSTGGPVTASKLILSVGSADKHENQIKLVPLACPPWPRAVRARHLGAGVGIALRVRYDNDI